MHGSLASDSVLVSLFVFEHGTHFSCLNYHISTAQYIVQSCNFYMAKRCLRPAKHKKVLFFIVIFMNFRIFAYLIGHFLA